MPSAWLVVVSWVALAVAFASAAWITWDIYGRGYRQHMKVMDIVWPVTALYFGPAAIAAYRSWGARRPTDGSARTMPRRTCPDTPPPG